MQIELTLLPRHWTKLIVCVNMEKKLEKGKQRKIKRNGPWRRGLQATDKHKQRRMKYYTNLKRILALGPKLVESTVSSFHAVQSSVLQFALHEDTAPGFTKRRSQRRRNYGIALKHYPKKTFPFVG